MPEQTTALVERDAAQQLQILVGHEIKTPQDYADRMRAAQGQAHILTSMSAVSWIAPGHVINPMIVVIDPSVDPDTGRGADVYFQRSIHKFQKRGDDYVPLEVSLNKHGLKRIMDSYGVRLLPGTPNVEIRERYWWIVTHYGELLTFDGQILALPPGIASVDLRDGSADIDEWTPEAWAEAERVAEIQRGKVAENVRWKVKPVIKGCAWTRERVMQQRKFGLELATTKSLNRLIRNLGVRQSYSVDDLRKPFVIFRATFIPDVSNPHIAEMLAQRHLGARSMLYPHHTPMPEPHAMPAFETPISHAPGEPAIEGEIAEGRPESTTLTSAPPGDATEATFDEPKSHVPVYLVTKVLKRGKDGDMQYFVETKLLDEQRQAVRDVTLFTTDMDIARVCAQASKDGQPREIVSERVRVKDETYLQILELSAHGGLKL